LVHSVHNNGTWDFWYFGHDVYVLNDTSVYLTAYIAEGLTFGAAVTWKLLFEGQTMSEDPVFLSDLRMESKTDNEDPKPMLVHSESAYSTSSIMG
jgi:hypothetical protein